MRHGIARCIGWRLDSPIESKTACVPQAQSILAGQYQEPIERNQTGASAIAQSKFDRALHAQQVGRLGTLSGYSLRPNEQEYMNAITDSENSLFEEWRQSCPTLVSDGVVDVDLYLASVPKILFVLKEVNSPGLGGWDVRNVMREAKRSATWLNVARWVEAIRNPWSEDLWSATKDLSEDRRRAALRSIAVMNLKKTPGGHTTNHSELRQAALRDLEFLRRQFFLYDADIVVSCGRTVTDGLDPIVNSYPENRWTSTARGIEYREYRPLKYIIDYTHPEARVADSFLYYGLADAIREIYSVRDRGPTLVDGAGAPGSNNPRLTTSP